MGLPNTHLIAFARENTHFASGLHIQANTAAAGAHRNEPGTAPPCPGRML